MAKRAGFTLIELLVVIAISTGVLGVMSESFIDGWQAQLSQQTMSELQQGSRLTVDEISKQARASTTVVSTISDGLSNTYSSSANSLVLRLPPIDGNEKIIAGDDYLIFRINPNDSKKTERIIIASAGSQRVGTTSPLSLNLDTENLTVRYFNGAGIELVPGTDDLAPARKIQIISESARTTNGRLHQRAIEASVNLRNKGI